MSFDIPLKVKGLNYKSRAIITKLSSLKMPFSLEEASLCLSIDKKKLVPILFSLKKSGWITGIKRGLYTLLPISSTAREVILDHPFVIAKKIYTPCYIGGWSAISYWDLTDQIFNTTYVYTTSLQTKRVQTIKNQTFFVKKIPESFLFGLQTIWQDTVPLQISDPTKTILDLLMEPKSYGGIRVISDVFKDYLESNHLDYDKLLSYTLKSQNKSLFKRLGFLGEVFNINNNLFIEACKNNISKGYTALDPSLPRERLIKKWNIWVTNPWRDYYYDQKR